MCGPTWIFIYGTDAVDRGLIVLFFRYFFSLPPPWKRLNCAIFWSFFRCFPPPPTLEIFLPTRDVFGYFRSSLIDVTNVKLNKIKQSFNANKFVKVTEPVGFLNYKEIINTKNKLCY